MSTLSGEILLRVLVLSATCALLFLLPFLLLWAGIKKKSRWRIVALATWWTTGFFQRESLRLLRR